MIPRIFAARCTAALMALATLTACEPTDEAGWQGYVEAEYTYVAPLESGRITELAVARGDTVKAGQELFALEQDAELAARDQAAAELAQAESDLADLQKGERPEDLAIIQAQLPGRGHQPLQPAQGRPRGAQGGASLRTARAILRRRGADVVLGGGGYVAGPVGLAAVPGRIPLVLTEADSHMGLTNRLLAGRARRVCLAFPLPGRDGGRYLVTGRPVPPRTAPARRRAPPSGSARRSAACSSSAARSAPAHQRGRGRAFADAPYRILHIAGRRDHPDLRRPGRTTTCATTSPRSAPRWPPRTSRSPARAARSSSSPSTASRPC